MTLTLLTVLVFAVAADFREMRISNRLIASGLMMGLTLRILGEGGAGIVHFLVNILFGYLCSLFQLRVIGAGDIKLFSVAGGFLSMRQLLYVILAAFVTAAVIGLGKLLYQKRMAGIFGNQRTLIHFSAMILIGYFIVVWGVPLNKIAVAVCDTDREYRDRFVTYLVERKAEEYAVSAFSMPEKLLEALEEKKPDLAICGTGFEEMAERLAGYDIPVLVLQETMADAVAEPVTYGSVPESCRGICRYQSMEVILHEVQVMTLTGAGSRRMENVGTGMEVIGVYSPICHEMQMPFSMVLAQKLSTEKKVLYVNLMEHSGMLELLGVPGECDLGEVILALRRQRLTAETLGRGIHETEWMHYVEPFDNPEDLGEMTAGDLQELISFLEKQMSYEILLLDFGQGLRDFLSFLGLCTSIYCPMKSGFYYDCRMEHFRRYLEREPAADIADRMQVIRLPFSAGKIRAGMDVYRQFLWSEFGDYVRNHIGGQEE